jgi:hypothetical protein
VAASVEWDAATRFMRGHRLKAPRIPWISKVKDDCVDPHQGLLKPFYKVPTRLPIAPNKGQLWGSVHKQTACEPEYK